jgi:two-component system, OmpR family, aerobic respiration control sensor histidine kinase ArcB
MAGIRGCTQLIRDCLANSPMDIKKMLDYVQDLDTSSEALLTLLNHVLESIQATSGGLPLRCERFHLEQKLLQVLQLTQARAGQKQLSLSLHHDERIPYLVGDGERIQRIVLELVTNALNFTDQGYVTVTTQLAKRWDRRVIIKIMVEDTGIGIPRESQQTIFFPFKRLIPAHKGTYSGAGLGLAIIKQFIDDLEGEIYLESEPGRGAQFTCTIRLKAALLNEGEESSQAISSHKTTRTAATQTSNHTDASPINRSPIHVLLVEDDQIITRVMVLLLTKLNCVVEVAANARCALNKAKHHAYELIFLDIGLPDGSGNEVASEIRHDNNSQNQVTPIVAVTAHVDGENKRQCQLAGINAVFPKPLSEEAVREILGIFVGVGKN